MRVLTAVGADTAEEEDTRRTGEQAAGSLGVGCGSLVLDSKTSQAEEVFFTLEGGVVWWV